MRLIWLFLWTAFFFLPLFSPQDIVKTHSTQFQSHPENWRDGSESKVSLFSKKHPSVQHPKIEERMEKKRKVKRENGEELSETMEVRGVTIRLQSFSQPNLFFDAWGEGYTKKFHQYLNSRLSTNCSVPLCPAPYRAGFGAQFHVLVANFLGCLNSPSTRFAFNQKSSICWSCMFETQAKICETPPATLRYFSQVKNDVYDTIQQACKFDHFPSPRRIKYETIKFFSRPNKSLKKKVKILRQSSNMIEGRKCVAVHYRGTDKKKESEVFELHLYMMLAFNLMRELNLTEIRFSSDEPSHYSLLSSPPSSWLSPLSFPPTFSEIFSEREKPVTLDGIEKMIKYVDRNSLPRLGISRDQYQDTGINFMGNLVLLSECEVIIGTCSSNVGRFLYDLKVLALLDMSPILGKRESGRQFFFDLSNLPNCRNR